MQCQGSSVTTEVIIMNREAIALAADSAVTFHQSGKVFHSANKLYMLAPNHPVGVLVFNNASFMGVSWELIIKLYRDHLVETGEIFDILEDYATAFIEFMQNNESMLFPKQIQDDYFKGSVENLMRNDIFHAVNKQVEAYIIKNAEPVEGHKVLEIARAIIDAICSEWEQSPDLSDIETNREFEAKLEEGYRSVFEDYYQRWLSQLGLGNKDKERLWKNCVLWFTKERWFSQRFTGVCFAGYGKKDLYPSFTHYNFESYMCDTFKYFEVQTHSALLTAGVFPLAQSDIINMLISGIHDQGWNGLKEILTRQISNTYKTLLSQLPEPPTDIDNEVVQMVQNDYENVVQALQKDMFDKYTFSIMMIVQGLPKEELALMAETLVNTTSYMRRVSRGQETVGGPTDVAVISKKDGFIWVKRKHYFDPDKNYHFFNRR